MGKKSSNLIACQLKWNSEKRERLGWRRSKSDWISLKGIMRAEWGTPVEMGLTFPREIRFNYFLPANSYFFSSYSPNSALQKLTLYTLLSSIGTDSQMPDQKVRRQKCNFLPFPLLTFDRSFFSTKRSWIVAVSLSILLVFFSPFPLQSK